MMPTPPAHGAHRHESASQRVLDEIMTAGITIEQVRAAVHTAKAWGWCAATSCWARPPRPRRRCARAFAHNELPLDDVTLSITTPLPHTHLYDMTRDLIAADFTCFDYYKT